MCSGVWAACISADGTVIFNGQAESKQSAVFPFAVSGLEVPWVQSLSVEGMSMLRIGEIQPKMFLIARDRVQ